MSSTAILLPVLAGGGSATLIATGVGGIFAKVLKRVAADVVRAELTNVTTKVSAIELKLATETGGNSGGLRQAVNDQAKTLSDVRADLAHVKGLVQGGQQTSPTSAPLVVTQ